MSYSIFALEIAARTYPGDPFRRQLHELVRPHQQGPSRARHRAMVQRIVQSIASNFAAVDRGCWDYFDDHDKALADFDMWTKGMTTEEGVRHQPSPDPPPRYLTFTMAFLMVNGSMSDMVIRKRCEVAQSDLWKRSSFLQVLYAAAAINFSHVKADVTYLIPGDGNYALTPQDLATPKFHYLRMLAV